MSHHGLEPRHNQRGLGAGHRSSARRRTVDAAIWGSIVRPLLLKFCDRTRRDAVRPNGHGAGNSMRRQIVLPPNAQPIFSPGGAFSPAPVAVLPEDPSPVALHPFHVGLDEATTGPVARAG